MEQEPVTPDVVEPAETALVETEEHIDEEPAISQPTKTMLKVGSMLSRMLSNARFLRLTRPGCQAPALV